MFVWIYCEYGKKWLLNLNKPVDQTIYIGHWLFLVVSTRFYTVFREKYYICFCQVYFVILGEKLWNFLLVNTSSDVIFSPHCQNCKQFSRSGLCHKCLGIVSVLATRVSHAKTTEPIKIPFGPKESRVIWWGCTLAPPGKHNGIIVQQQRCGLMLPLLLQPVLACEHERILQSTTYVQLVIYPVEMWNLPNRDQTVSERSGSNLTFQNVPTLLWTVCLNAGNVLLWLELFKLIHRQVSLAGGTHRMRSTTMLPGFLLVLPVDQCF